MPELILASKSPRRSELLADYGYDFRVQPPQVPEPPLTDQLADPTDLVQTLAHFKAIQVAKRFPKAVVLAADTVAALAGRVFGKPEDQDHARQILSTLAGTRHEVITGVAIIHLQASKKLIYHERTAIHMRPLTDHQLDQYIRSGAWQGKAGAYAIQEGADQYIQRIDGSFSNVVGLPMELTKRMLEQFAILPARDIPA